MQAQAQMMSGTRLAYVAVPIKEKVVRYITKYEKGKGLYDEPVEEAGGYMVYFPRGHALRLTEKQLKRYKINKKARVMVDMSQLMDPESTIGKIFMSQSQSDRAESWKDLERQVIQLATAKTGNQLLTSKATPTEREDAE